MIRSFVGIRIDPEMLQRISEVQSQLQQKLRGVRWVRKENLHLTLKFLGDTPEEKVGPLVDALEPVLTAIAPFRIIGRGIGVFPDIRRARILWAGLEGDDLARLVMEVERAVEPFGFEKEKRDFRPHLTIGRWRRFDGRSDLIKQEIERLKDYEFGDSRVGEVTLFQSILRSEGAVYSPLKVMGLGDHLQGNVA